MTNVILGVGTDLQTFTARRKLPDDLALIEYAEIVSALESLCFVAAQAQPYIPRPQIIRAQYGSDFLIIASISAAAVTTLGALCLAAKHLTQSGVNLAERNRIKAERERLVAETDFVREQAERARLDNEFLRLEMNERVALMARVSKASQANTPDEARTIADSDLVRVTVPAELHSLVGLALAEEASRAVTVIATYDLDLDISPG